MIVNKVQYFKNNYATCENQSVQGYDLISRDENGNIIKIQHSLWTRNSKNKMDYSQFDKSVAKKKAQSKFLSLSPLGESGDYIFAGMTQIQGLNYNKTEMEDQWFIELKGTNPEIPDEKKNWTTASLKVYEQFVNQKIQEGDKIRITREPTTPGKTKYIVTKIS